MSADYVAGSLALLLIVLPWLVGAPRLARRLAPDWQGATFALAAGIVGISGVLVVAELCGIAGGFSRWTVAIAQAVTGLGAAAIGRGSTSQRPRFSLPTGWSRRVALGGVALCVLALSATFLARDARALQTGPNDADSLHYHLSSAAQFVHSHTIDHLHQTGPSDPSVYYPYDAELLDAVGMLGPHPDLGVFGLNLIFGWLALLACWVIGARWSMAEPATAAGAVVLALPLVAGASSGPGLNDVPTMAFFLSGIALLLSAGLPRGHASGDQVSGDQVSGNRVARGSWAAKVAVAGLALGLGAGSKISTLAPVGLLAIAALLIAKGDRRLFAGVVTASAVLTGGFWYFRDWAVAGSPLPSLNLTIGGHGLHQVPYPEVKPFDFTVLHYLGNYSVIRHWYVPGLHAAWSFLWPLVLLMLVAGVMFAAFADRDWSRRGLAVVVILGFIAYLVTPTTALGPSGQPVLFAANSRYALPVIALAMILFATSRVFRRHDTALTVAFTILVFVLLADRHFGFKLAYVRGIEATVVLVAAAAGLGVLWVRAGRHAALAGAVVLGVAVVGAGYAVQHKYLEDRYAEPDALDLIFHAVAGLSGQRVEVSGHGLQYPFFGTSFGNEVTYLGVAAKDKSYDAPRSCTATRAVLAANRATILMVEPYGSDDPEQPAKIKAWAVSIPGARVAIANSAGTVIALPAHITNAGC